MSRSLLAAGLVLVVGAVAVWWWRERETTLDAVQSAVRARYPEVTVVSTGELAEALSDPTRAPFLLDAREREEFAVSHLPGARRIDPDASAPELRAALAEVSVGREIVVYCSVGYRSAGVAERLREAGFESVANLEGSIFRWANEGRPLVRGDGEPTDVVHPYSPMWGRLLHPARRARLADPPRGAEEGDHAPRER